jgi:hypothetical protein
VPFSVCFLLACGPSDPGWSYSVPGSVPVAGDGTQYAVPIQGQNVEALVHASLFAGVLSIAYELRNHSDVSVAVALTATTRDSSGKPLPNHGSVSTNCAAEDGAVVIDRNVDCRFSAQFDVQPVARGCIGSKPNPSLKTIAFSLLRADGSSLAVVPLEHP